MARSIIIDFPSIDLSVRAELWEAEEPELCETLWENIGSPLRMVCRHPVSSGQEFARAGRLNNSFEFGGLPFLEQTPTPCSNE